MRRVVGEGAADADGKGNINAGDGGVAFLLASAGTLPGACDAVRCHHLYALLLHA